MMFNLQPCKQLEEVLAEELDQMISMEVLQVNETLVSVFGFDTFDIGLFSFNLFLLAHDLMYILLF